MTTATLQIAGLGKHKIARLRAQAKSLGMSAEGYARQLIEDGLSLETPARSKSFDELFGPAQAKFRKTRMTEQDLDQLVDAARTRNRRVAHTSR